MQTTRTRARGLIVALAALSLTAAACGSDDSGTTAHPGPGSVHCSPPA